MNRKPTKAPKLLTSVELEVMNAIWDLGSSTVKDVQHKIAGVRDLAYTSVATIMKILEQKGFLKSEKSDRAHIYNCKITRTEYEATALKHVTENVFQGNPSSMVMRLLSDADLSEAELEDIRTLLNERLKT